MDNSMITTTREKSAMMTTMRAIKENQARAR